MGGKAEKWKQKKGFVKPEKNVIRTHPILNDLLAHLGSVVSAAEALMIDKSVKEEIADDGASAAKYCVVK